MALLSPFVFVMSVAVSHSSTPPLKAVILSPSLTVCLMFGPSAGLLCFVCDITALFSVLSQYSSSHLSVASVLCEGYLAAISGFIFALSFGLSQRCCPCVIVCHHQGGDLSLRQHLKMLPGMSWRFLLGLGPFRTVMDNYCDVEAFGFYLHPFLDAGCQNI